jgi:DNA invertase Pin-like site-specific DNA recombinase
MIPADVYLRVSSKDGRQDEANQEPDCARLCEARGFEATWFRERESGAKKRPEWDRVLERARVGHSRVVVFWSVDRVGRTRVEVMKDLWELARTGVAVVSCKERIVDIPAAGADASPLLVIMREQAIGWLTFAAEDERRKLIERTRAGLARARAAGVVFGRKRRPIDLEVARTLLAQEGATPASVARVLNVPRKTLVDHLAEKGGKNP